MSETKWKPTPKPWKVRPIAVDSETKVPPSDPNRCLYRGQYQLQYDQPDFQESPIEALVNSRVMSTALDGLELAEIIVVLGVNPAHARYIKFPKSIVDKARAIVEGGKGVMQEIPSQNPSSDAHFAVSSWTKHGMWAICERQEDGSYIVWREGGKDTRYFQKPLSKGN